MLADFIFQQKKIEQKKVENFNKKNRKLKKN